MIKIILPTRFVPIINKFYSDSYDRYLNREKAENLWVDEKSRRYTRRMYLANIRKVLSVNGKDLEKLDNTHRQISTYSVWNSLGYHYFLYEHWYFAFENPVIPPDGRTYIEIKDIIYEGEYHNNMMSEPIYLQEYQLRSIIRESIKKILFQSYPIRKFTHLG